MTPDNLISNLTNPAFLFFLLGIFAVKLKSDLRIPSNSATFISLYLLFSIGFKGGQELSHSAFTSEIVFALLFGIGIAMLIPLYVFLVLRHKLGNENAGAIAAAYGSVSAVTFVTGISFLEAQGLTMDGYMVAVMAFMEAPAIVVGVFLINQFNGQKEGRSSIGGLVKHSFTNGSVLLILGSLIIGFLANEEQAKDIKPFTTDLFKGFLAIFLLDMGMSCGRKLQDFFSNGFSLFLIAILIPFLNGSLVAFVSGGLTDNPGNRFMFAVLAASASYIAVPAAMKIAVPKANSGIYIPMALAVTFPFNITIGMPLYMYVVNHLSL
jgi:uncharacterized protein